MSADKLEAFPSNKPPAAEVTEVLDWLVVNKPRLNSDQRALVDGCTPRPLLAYESATMPAALVAGGDITEAMVATCDMLRLSRTDENLKLAKQKLSHEAELRNSLFDAISASLTSKAPLLLKGLKGRTR